MLYGQKAAVVEEESKNPLTDENNLNQIQTPSKITNPIPPADPDLPQKLQKLSTIINSIS